MDIQISFYNFHNSIIYCLDSKPKSKFFIEEDLVTKIIFLIIIR